MLSSHCSLNLLNRSLIRTFISSVLAAIGLLCGTVPEVSWHPPHLNFNLSAYTQDFTDTQILNYARAVLQIEDLRREAYRRIQQIIGKPPQNLSCYQPDSLRGLPPQAQRIAVDFCNQSKRIAQNSGLTAAQFNAITRRAQRDRVLKRRIQNTIIKIRRQ